MIYALLFGVTAAVGLGLGFLAAQLGLPWLGGPFVWGALAFGVAALAYAGVGPQVFGKRADGTVPLWSYVAFGPFLVLGRAGLRAFNATGLETPWTSLGDNVWIGRRPQGSDGVGFLALQAVAVVDLTAEVARSRRVPADTTYLTLPTLDNASPRPEQLEAGVAFIEAQRARGPVYVHCALGNGRAATLVSAWLLATGRADDPAEAESTLQSLRPSVGLSAAQRRGLGTWWEDRCG